MKSENEEKDILEKAQQLPLPDHLEWHVNSEAVGAKYRGVERWCLWWIQQHEDDIYTVERDDPPRNDKGIVDCGNFLTEDEALAYAYHLFLFDMNLTPTGR